MWCYPHVKDEELVVMDMFMTQIMVMVSRMHTYLQCHQVHTLNIYSYTYVNHTSIKRLKKRRIWESKLHGYIILQVSDPGAGSEYHHISEISSTQCDLFSDSRIWMLQRYA